MIEIKNKALCTGCSACVQRCPAQCITMSPDNEGFLYPEIDHSRCINCGLCDRICPILSPGTRNQSSPPQAYAAYSKNEEIRSSSSSGGVFSEIATTVLRNGGVVFGAAFDETYQVAHIGIDNEADLHKLRGSKYVQSKIGTAYVQTEEHLQSGKQVLFSGTPCQISGLHSYLGKEYENLITVDIICHGVPSPAVWEEYIKFRADGREIENVSFRDKQDGWSKYRLTLSFTDKTQYSCPAAQDSFSRAFLLNLCLRPSCYQCKHKGIHRQSDITLADFWGLQAISPQLYDEKGVSLVLCHSNKGQALLNQSSADIFIVDTCLESAIQHNQSAVKSTFPHPNRMAFLHDVLHTSKNFEASLIKNAKLTILQRVISKIKRTLQKH